MDRASVFLFSLKGCNELKAATIEKSGEISKEAHRQIIDAIMNAITGKTSDIERHAYMDLTLNLQAGEIVGFGMRVKIKPEALERERKTKGKDDEFSMYDAMMRRNRGIDPTRLR